MAVISVDYQSQTAMSASSNLSSQPSNTVRGMGSVAASQFGSNPVGYKVDAKITLTGSGVTSTGYISFYLVESNDGGTTWTDSVNVSTTASQGLTNARLVATAIATANSQVVSVNFDLPTLMAPQTFSIMVSNATGAAFSNAGYAIHVLPVNYQVA